MFKILPSPMALCGLEIILFFQHETQRASPIFSNQIVFDKHIRIYRFIRELVLVDLLCFYAHRIPHTKQKRMGMSSLNNFLSISIVS